MANNGRNQINQVNEKRMNFLNENGLRLVFLFICLLTGNWLNLEQTVAAEERKLPLVINTWAFTDATKEGWQALTKPNGNVLDAVENGCSKCEEIGCDGSVGSGSHPDENGIVTLDAMIMDGKTQNVGAVAQMHNVKNAISVARKVLEHSYHSLLVGQAATKFAQVFDFKLESLETENSNMQHSKWLKNKCQPNFWYQMIPSDNCGPYKPIPANIDQESVIQNVNYSAESVHEHDTIGMIAIDTNKNIAVGTSTNGANHKISGRVGDTAIPGAGGFADNEFGAAVCTGDGDIIMRFSPAALAVHYLEQGINPSLAAEIVLRKIYKKFPKSQVAIVVVNKQGDFSAACFNMNRFPFSFQNNEVNQVQVQYVDCFN